MTQAASLAQARDADHAFIFVYGGLMRGFDLHHFLAGTAFICTGSTRGTLVTLGRYPGLVEGTGEVRGEIYRLDDAAAQLEALDELEEYDPAQPEESAYVRVQREVRRDDGPLIQAWVYLYDRDASGYPAIAGGDWHRTGIDR